MQFDANGNPGEILCLINVSDYRPRAKLACYSGTTSFATRSESILRDAQPPTNKGKMALDHMVQKVLVQPLECILRKKLGVSKYERGGEFYEDPN